MEQNVELTEAHAEAVTTMYTMLASSFPSSWNHKLNSHLFNIWKLTLANYPPNAIIKAAEQIPTLRRSNGLPYDFPPSLPVVADMIMRESIVLMGHSDHDKAYERLFKFKRKSPAERAATGDNFVYTLYRQLNNYMAMDADKFRPIFTREYLKLADGVTKGSITLDEIPLAIESK
ncbi:hypothetical protein AKG98_4130 [Moritella sp. JT01]|uniref:hypothetical protein n=1 Tax=Moritella sp. JT01 TaxID=756698 RepID=UPI00079B9FDA|nr:hypothetical protein [Moritella sp. JT01]KXO12931.1 hypothetical protein AKG98_4130 [Moritella sp. JT01]